MNKTLGAIVLISGVGWVLTTIAILVLTMMGAPAHGAENAKPMHSLPGAIVCKDPEILVRLARPHARVDFGDLNYFRLAEIGGCWQIDGKQPLAFCTRGSQVSLVREVIAGPSGYATGCQSILTSDLVNVK